MDNAQFWRLIGDSKAQSGSECEAQAASLLRLLSRLPGKEIIAFEAVFNTLRQRAYKWDLWGAAYIINGGASDDSFEYFRWWLIGQGEQTYETALRDPDSLADIIDPNRDDYGCEAILYCVSDAYRAVAGQETPSPDTPYTTAEPAGTRWQEDELDAMFPRLCALCDGADETTP